MYLFWRGRRVGLVRMAICWREREDLLVPVVIVVRGWKEGGTIEAWVLEALECGGGFAVQKNSRML
jgi:hypothetical protein